jgi:hypothetical protein
LPAHVTLERALQFEAGGVMFGGEQFDWVKDHMLSFCARGKQNLLIFEDQVWRRGDKGISDISSNMFYYDNEVYYYIECGVVSGDKIVSASREVKSFLSISFLVNAHGLLLQRGRTIEIRELDEIAANVSEILVSAYDQEGVVVWSRTPGG